MGAELDEGGAAGMAAGGAGASAVASGGFAAGGGEVGGGEFFDEGGVAGTAGGGDGDAFDEVGHGHFDVEFDEVCEGVELDVALRFVSGGGGRGWGGLLLTRRSWG